jgi:hypothetical protein
VQYAVDQAQAGEEIRVASGDYTGVQTRTAPAGYDGPTVITQVVYISKTITIRGGHTTAFTDPPDPETNQTTLDAQGKGRVFFITGDISPTIEGLHITGGDAAGLGGYTSIGPRDVGGGVYVISATATISNNRVFSNTGHFYGGGLYLDYYSDATLTNNVVADNQADTAGSGLYIHNSSPRLLHTTIARNREGDGIGVYVTNSESDYSTVALTNTILVSHSVGITVTAGNTATLESTLWHGNTSADWGGAGAINHSNDYTGDPRFDADGYHLMDGSAAIDKGMDVGVTTDIDGDSRPQGSAPDLGADELTANIYLPIILKNASP